MDTVSVMYILIISLLISQILTEEIPDDCGKGTFHLSLFGRRLPGDHWNTSYILKGSSCKSFKNWHLVMYQNVTDQGKLQHIDLQGYFTDQIHTAEMNGSLPLVASQAPLDSVRQTIPDSVTNGTCKGSNLTEPSQMKIVTRIDWNARRPTKTLNALVIPVKNLYVYSSGAGYSCSNYKECTRMMQKLQDHEMSAGDIFANFHIGGDGRVYEGVGWNRSMNHGQLNLKYLGSCPPVAEQPATLALLIKNGIRTGKISKEYKLEGGCSDELKIWMNWAKNLDQFT